MKTVLLRIEDSPGGDYSISLREEQNGQWAEPPLAEIIVSSLVPGAGGPTPIASAAQVAGAVGQTEMGGVLYTFLFQAEVAREWKKLSVQYPGEKPNVTEGLRTLLEVRPTDLRALPWEALHEPMPGRALFGTASNPWARWIDSPAARPAIEVRLPIRVLVVVGCKPDDKAVDWESELQAIRKACNNLRHGADLHVLHQQTAAAIGDEYDKFLPHVFHFIGHGTDPGTGVPAALILTTTDGQPAHAWTAQQISQRLSNWWPRIVILNACDTGTASQRRGAWELADTFFERGARAVLTMQGKVNGALAASYAARLYERLKESIEFDRAASEARGAMSVGPNDPQWSLPSVTLSVMPSAVLPVSTAASPALLQRISMTSEFRDIMNFVGRRETRRTISRGVAPPPESGKAPRDLLIIRGASRVGKTALAMWCLEECARRGEPVAYVDLRSPTSLNFLDVLRLLRDGPDKRQISRPDGKSHATCVVCHPLRESAFYRFNEGLNQWLQGKPLPTTLTGLPVVDEDRQLAGLVQPAETLVTDIFSSFRAALRDAAMPQAPASSAQSEGLTIVLDHLSVGAEGVAPAHYPALEEHFFLPIAQGDLRPVRLILVVSDDVNPPDLRRVLGSAIEVIVPEFTRDEWVPVAIDHFYLTKPNDQSMTLSELKGMFAQMYEAFIGSPGWKPARLRDPLGSGA